MENYETHPRVVAGDPAFSHSFDPSQDTATIEGFEGDLA